MVGAGAVAYHAGKSVQAGRDQDAYQDEQLQELQAQQMQAQQMQMARSDVREAPSGGLSSEAMAQLEQLAQLRERGILNNEEFEAQKKKILMSGW
jgi:hypothetical protein